MIGAPPRITRIIHTNAKIALKPLEQIAPDVKTERTDGGEGPVMGLAFQDPDGDLHVFVLDEQRLEKLKSDIIGGIAIPAPSSIVVPH
jgi:hypothetical protein